MIKYIPHVYPINLHTLNTSKEFFRYNDKIYQYIGNSSKAANGAYYIDVWSVSETKIVKLKQDVKVIVLSVVAHDKDHDDYNEDDEK
jgi:hypothetical protein